MTLHPSRLLCRIALAGIMTSTIAAFPVAPLTTVRVTVRVTDASGAEIPEATVLITPLSDGLLPASGAASLTTNHKGTVTATLNPGTYTLSVRAPGFKTTLYQQVRLDKSLSLTITLQIANYDGPVQVTPIDNPALVPKSTTLQELIPETAN